MKARSIGLVIIAVVTIVMLMGCGSTSVITEFDRETGKKVKVTETKESITEQILASTADKSVFVFDKGWWFGAEASIFSADSPVPITRILAKKNNRGILTLHKDQRNMAEIRDIVKATLETESLAVTATGVTSSSASSPTETK
jgi:predicted double-glycine peptidase